MKEHHKRNRSLRDLLAIDRTRLANRRTLLAFIITSLHVAALGMTFEKVNDFEGLHWLAIPLYALAVLNFIIGVLSYLKIRRDVDYAYGIAGENEE